MVKFGEMDKKQVILVLGSTGMVGSAIVRKLKEQGYSGVVESRRLTLNLLDADAVISHIRVFKPSVVFLAAAKVGGIKGNSTYPADFIVENIRIQTNVIDACRRAGIQNLFFLGSSCIYPRNCPQPIKEEYLMRGILEQTNSAYAVAKIAGIEMCRAHNRQHGTNYISVMPTNLYGYNDNYHPDNSHVIPGLIDRMHKVKEQGGRPFYFWGTGSPLREFLHADDLADCLIQLMELPGPLPDLINIGSGEEVTIKQLVHKVAAAVGWHGNIHSNNDKALDGTPRKLLNCDVLKNLLPNWKPKISLPYGLQLTYADYLKGHRS